MTYSSKLQTARLWQSRKSTRNLARVLWVLMTTFILLFLGCIAPFVPNVWAGIAWAITTAYFVFVFVEMVGDLVSGYER